MKKIIKKMRQVVQVVLLAPIKLPTKVKDIIRYIGVGLGVIDAVLDEQPGSSEPIIEAKSPQHATEIGEGVKNEGD